MMSLWDALRMNMMISYQELVRTFLNEFFDRGIWRLIWKNACTFRLRWRLGRRYLRIKRYRHAG
ncbi:hypothetical protein CI651_02125 [Klebsiella pneumoniae subsp. pneumoniae]|nr:hypothetical protein [Klebsiella pneumoniae]OYF88771.1 hypothetical protein CI651_02125 [Klebsiella pneumoniae subsp. pneumoniae]